MFLRNIAILSLACVTAGKGSSDCVSGIDTALTSFSFASPDEELESYYENSCSNVLFVNSLWSAAKLYCAPADILAGGDYLNATCLPQGFLLPSYQSVEANLTDDFIKGLEVVGFDDIAEGKTYNSSILPSQSLLQASIKTVVVFNESVSQYKLFSWIICGFWGLVLLSGTLYRFVHFIRTSNLPQSTSDAESACAFHQYPHNRVLGNVCESPWHWIRANVILPATFGTYHKRPWWGCNLPTRVQFLVLVLYYILTIVLCVISYEIFYPNLYYTWEEQIWRYISDRTGALSYANIPILWLFAGRNNIFIWATGWDFATFNLFHRQIARVTTILAIVHSVGYSMLTVKDGGTYKYEWTQLYWVMGAVATVTMSLILPFSFIIVRRHRYELFLISHILLSLAALVALYYHTRDYGPGEFDPYLWAAVAIWCFDRLARFVRWIYCNIHVSLKDLATTKANVIYNQDADTIVLKITPGAHHLKPSPGQHYFIYQCNAWRGWENHPFSLASWKQAPVASEFGMQPATVEGPSKSEFGLGSPPSPVIESQPSATDAQEFTFYIRPSKGFTNRLRKRCLSRTEPTPLRLLLEGPYGHSFPSHTYDTLVLVAGGSGIAGVLPYLEVHEKISRTTRIRLIWTTKQVGMIMEVAKRELSDASGITDFETSFYVTGQNQMPKTERNELGFDIKTGRPNVGELVSDEIQQSGQRRIAIVACGPVGMADEARACVHVLLLEGFKGLEYIEESFSW